MTNDLFELLRAGHEVRITRCERHKDWMRDITADCPDPCPDCVYEPIRPATSEEPES
jgi:hypothetical protein